MIRRLPGNFCSDAAASRSSPLRLQGIREVAAAQGTVKFDSGDNGNTRMDIRVEHLAAPANVGPGDSTYVVWVQGNGDTPPQNVDALAVDGNLAGRLNTVTSMHAFQLFITPEQVASVAAPTGPRVRTGSYSR